MEKWRIIQKESITSLAELIEYLELDETKSKRVIKRPFPLLLPRRIAEKIPKNDLDSPLAKQFIPTEDELTSSGNFLENPLLEKPIQGCPKLLHKYKGRVLLLSTGACAMHCRYCFRQNHPYTPSTTSLKNELEYIRKDETIHEVILSGGDPLSLSDDSLSQLIQEISSIPHIKIIRFHSRFPIGIPERISDTFLAILQRCPKQIVFILHVNHASELDETIISHLRKIQCLGIPILTQSVLLAGVNDTIDHLRNLCLTLAAMGLIPYYLHQLDQVRGAEHFEVDIPKGVTLIEQLRTMLPGYAVPTFVQEIPEKASKIPLLQ